jgi:hypothetical protein
MTDDKFPRGKLSAEDEGSTPMMIYTQDKTVIIRFEKPVSWIGMDGEMALKMAELLIQHARTCGIKRPVSITL